MKARIRMLLSLIALSFLIFPNTSFDCWAQPAPRNWGINPFFGNPFDGDRSSSPNYFETDSERKLRWLRAHRDPNQDIAEWLRVHELLSQPTISDATGRQYYATQQEAWKAAQARRLGPAQYFLSQLLLPEDAGGGLFNINNLLDMYGGFRVVPTPKTTPRRSVVPLRCKEPAEYSQPSPWLTEPQILLWPPKENLSKLPDIIRKKVFRLDDRRYEYIQAPDNLVVRAISGDVDKVLQRYLDNIGGVTSKNQGKKLAEYADARPDAAPSYWEIMFYGDPHTTRQQMDPIKPPRMINLFMELTTIETFLDPNHCVLERPNPDHWVLMSYMDRANVEKRDYHFAYHADLGIVILHYEKPPEGSTK